MNSRRSIAFEFMVAVLIALVIGQGVLGLWFLFNQKHSFKSIHEAKAEIEARFLADYAADFIKNGRREVIDGYLKALRSDVDMISFQVRRADGRVVLKENFTASRDDDGFNPFYVPASNPLRVPIVQNGLMLGEVELQYSGAHINDEMRRLLTIFPAVQSLVFLCAAFVIYLVFRAKIGRPLDELGRQIGQVTEGDLSISVSAGYEGEIAVVAKGIQILVDRLSYTIARLEAASEKVSRTSRQVTSSTRALGDSVRKQSDATESIVILLKGASETHRQLIGITEDVSHFSTENVSSLLQVKAMGDEIVSGMETLYRASEISLSNVSQMSQTSKVMARSARDTLSLVESISSSVEEVIASVKEVERNAKNSSELAENVRAEAAKQGVEGVALAIDGMGKINDVVTRTVQQVTTLHDSSKDIQKILNVIREITEQTNLLSLNASILAEKAGEQGKGFSVVAEEMRSLSNRTASYTKEISRIVKSIQSGIEDTVEMIGLSTKMVARQSENVYKVGETMSGILDAAYNSAAMANGIERATVEQVKALQMVSVAMLDVNAMALNTKRAMDEQVMASAHMHDQVADVKDIAESTKKGVNEQDGGVKMIARNMEFANDKMAHVRNFILNQQKVNEEISSSVGEIHSVGSVNLKDIEVLAETLESLQREVSQIGAEMDSFRSRS